MKQKYRTQIRQIKERMDKLDDRKEKQYFFAQNQKQYDAIVASRPENAVIICWRFKDAEAEGA